MKVGNGRFSLGLERPSLGAENQEIQRESSRWAFPKSTDISVLWHLGWRYLERREVSSDGRAGLGPVEMPLFLFMGEKSGGGHRCGGDRSQVPQGRGRGQDGLGRLAQGRGQARPGYLTGRLSMCLGDWQQKGINKVFGLAFFFPKLILSISKIARQ